MTSSLTSAEPKPRARIEVLVAYSVLALVGAAFFAFSFQFDFTNSRGLVGPGLLPRVSGLILVILSVLLILQEALRGSLLVGDSGVAADSAKPSRKTVRKLATVFGLITVTLLVVPFLGLIVSLTILVFVLTMFVERMPRIPSIIITVSAGVVAYLLFVVALQFRLPMGILEGIL
ncbi:tripartite tricarboxylate transporter TctB family protein [Salinibacterium sp. PAMC 21357]|uniref:tripartite tricarboxylate transporter TctB family protein n=1 Tax=Salinibacterium sp. PAMC 21357 TaxID=1112215 RepID=UPI0002883D0D|nr:tripartite tricarboxylate transporter TctB family protein [Salinibacterium sp. PAMC 21357]